MKTMTYGMIKQRLKKGEDMQETLEALVVVQQGHYYKVSLYNLLFNYMTFLESVQDEAILADLKLDAESDLLLKNMLAPLKGYSSLPDLQLDTKALLNQRHELEVRVAAITNYADELDQYEYIINRIEGAYMDQEEPLDDETLAATLIRFIFEDENNFVITEKMKTVLSQLPIRMTKQKFMDYISESMELFVGAYISSIDEFIAMMEEAVMPYETEAYTCNFHEIQEGLAQLRNTSYSGLDQQDFVEIYELKVQLSDRLNCLAGIYSLAVSILNNLIELSLCNQAQDLQEDPDVVRVGHMFLRMCQQMDDFQIDELMAKSLEGMEGVIEENLEESVRYNGLITHAMDQYGNDLNAYKLLDSYQNIERLAYMTATTSYFVDVFKEEVEGDETQVDDQILALKKEQVMNMLEQALEGRSREYRRSVMSKCFYLFPVCFKTPEAFHDYMLQALKQCSNIIEKNAVSEILLDFLETY